MGGGPSVENAKNRIEHPSLLRRRKWWAFFIGTPHLNLKKKCFPYILYLWYSIYMDFFKNLDGGCLWHFKVNRKSGQLYKWNMTLNKGCSYISVILQWRSYLARVANPISLNSYFKWFHLCCPCFFSTTTWTTHLRDRVPYTDHERHG